MKHNARLRRIRDRHRLRSAKSMLVVQAMGDDADLYTGEGGRQWTHAELERLSAEGVKVCRIVYGDVLPIDGESVKLMTWGDDQAQPARMERTVIPDDDAPIVEDEHKPLFDAGAPGSVQQWRPRPRRRVRG